MDTPYCLCGQPYNPNIFMIQCDLCKDWYHGSCVNFQEHLAIEIDKYHCPRCTPIFGPSINKPWKNYHRHDFWDENATERPVQTGTAVFIKELRARHFASEGEVVIHMRGQQLTETFLQQRGFDCPIVIDGKDGLEMNIPSDTFSLYDVESYIGGDHEMDVIDVTRQTDVKMKLRDFVAYFNSLNRMRVFNVVSLEFSGTGLSRLIDAPLVARKLDWANTVWPYDCTVNRPQVQKYCLMSVKDAYTDFHIDFGGTSVWYHVVWGEKIFYFIKPTPANLTLYQQWMTATNQSETFFGDQVDRCYKATLRQGQTMVIPTGWIHAVLTPIDSLVFGGNFLHSLNIPMQLQVYDIEKKIKTTEKFLYPHFEMINWFAAQKLLTQITEINSEEKRCPSTLLTGLKSLLSSLKQWNTEKDYNLSSREQIPISINTTKLLKDISKEIRHAERFINSLNPPKPERESKRKRKKPVNKDFVDYSLNTKNDFIVDIPEVPATTPIKLTLPKPAIYPYENSLNTQDIRNTFLEDSWGSSILSREDGNSQRNCVLKLKLGSKDGIPSGPDSNLSLDSALTFGSMSKSVYDFNDDSDRDDDCFNLSIDESPRKTKKSSGSLKMRLPNSWGPKSKKRDDLEDIPKNGIESLLKASALTNKFMDDGSGRTSPSTQEAIAGMLSISQTFIQPGRAPARSRKYRSLSNTLSEEEDINNVHQDEDYIYPSLDNSDDEDIHIFKPRGRSKIDEAWNPKARVGPLLPKMNRPAREGTKKQAVEKVLEAAAAKRACESPEKSPKRQYRRKKIKPKLTEKTTSSVPNTTTIASTSTHVVTTPRPRKGMKTAKQRLGKILKIHKMIH
ncbi:lysine-specific demethylase 7B-like isoform X1 [Onthophagus taurus]|uniref:lysine-specific demethylase 7B-like isoform X1 n=1 Tax=Onthophagus taurus TaxID=166361 RepID=UPI0039BE1FEE